jgi:hypothetical protein
MSRLNTFIEMSRKDYNFILSDLKEIKAQLDSEITSIDVRLCADLDLDGEMSWIIRSGDSSYDQRHSPVCGASRVEEDSDLTAVLEDLIDQCCDQWAEIDSIQGTESA